MNQERSVLEVQDECAAVAADLESLIHRLVRLRGALHLPPDSLALYEEEDIPWPVELEIDAGIGAVLDDGLEPAAELLRETAKVTDEQIRQRVLARRSSSATDQDRRPGEHGLFARGGSAASW